VDNRRCAFFVQIARFAGNRFRRLHPHHFVRIFKLAGKLDFAFHSFGYVFDRHD
jgi:hypothetical protein